MVAHGCMCIKLDDNVQYQYKAKVAFGRAKTKQNKTANSAASHLNYSCSTNNQNITCPLVLCTNISYSIHISNELLSSFSHKFFWIFFCSNVEEAEEEEEEVENDTRNWTVYFIQLCNVIVPFHYGNNKQKQNLPLFLWFFVRILLYQIRNFFETTKKDENETNYKMLEDVFYLLQNVIVRSSV